MPAPSLTRKSDGEWAAEGTRRSRTKTDRADAIWLAKAANLSKPGRRARERADLLFDAGIEAHLGADPIGVVEHHAQDRRVVVGEKSPQRLFSDRARSAENPSLGRATRSSVSTTTSEMTRI